MITSTACFLILLVTGSCVTREEKVSEIKEQTQPDDTIKAIHFGPYLQHMTSNGVVIAWSTLEGTSTIEDMIPMPEYKQHEIKLSGLTAGTTYSYNVLGDGRDEGKGSFTTFPDSIMPFRFAVLGDTRSRHDVHAKIVSMIMSKKPLLVVNTGDLVGDGNNIHDWERFFEVNSELMRNIPYFPVLGNHERDSEYYFDFFNLPGNERYYHFTIGDVLFIVLDTEGADYPTPAFIREENLEYFWENSNLDYFKEQKRWVEEILKLHDDAGFIFVFQHKPMYSIKASRLEEAAMRRKFWSNLFEKYKVQAVINGHDHHYHHAINKGTHFITTAGGGAGLYETDAPQPQTVKFSKIEHFMQVD
ncbi:MAG: metallophosphoesterase, partial [Cyclobacteriaceae bacterium]|nr:metallophosphoesterase [Cyclobacteriaceae bacterium]